MPINYGLLNTGAPAQIAGSFMQGYQQSQDRANMLAQQERQNKLAEIQMKAATRAEQLAEAERAAYNAAQTPADIPGALRAQGLGKEAFGVEAQMATQQAAQRKARLEEVKALADLYKRTATSVFADPANAKAHVVRFGQQTGSDVTEELRQIDAMGNDPAKIKAWAAGHAMDADKLLPKFETSNLGTTVERTGYDPMTGQPIGPAVSRPVTMTPGEEARLANDATRIALERQRVGLEGQRVGLEGRRVAVSESEAQRKATGTEGIPPKELQRRESVYPQATASVKSFEAKADSFVKDLEALKNHPGLSNITGVIAGRTPSLTREGRAAQALYDKIVAKGGFQALQDLRAASVTGGALGNVSNQEGKQLVASFAAIDQRQDAADVRNAIDGAIADVTGAKSRMREAYDMTYDYKQGKATKSSEADPLGIR